ncbi:MAG: hypothetical protein WC934_06040 [Acidithiobacillus sp.]|jgi:hypothetical protein
MQEFDDIINEINSTHNKFEKHKLCKELRNRTIFNETDTQNQANTC